MLTAIAEMGPSTPRAIAMHTKLDRATVYRLLQTLSDAGFVASGAGGRHYLTVAIHRLATGYDPRDALLSSIGPAMRALQAKTLWPVAYASLRGTEMVVEESTMPLSPYAVTTLTPGTALPVTRTTWGRAVLAAMSAADRAALIAKLDADHKPPPGVPLAESRLGQIISDTATRGYAYSVGELVTKMSGIALAVKHADKPIGAINLIFFTQSLSVSEAAEAYLPAMRHTVEVLEASIRSDCE